MPTAREIQIRADAVLEPLVTDLATRQATYASTHDGRYWQGLKTPAATPRDGADIVPDETRKPSDQAETWADLGVNLPATVPCSLDVHVHDGPDGKGFTVFAIIDHEGQVYRKAAGSGAHSLTQTWTVVEAERP